MHEELLYLKRRICIHLKLGHHLGPGFKLLALGVNVVIEDGALGWKLDGFELSHPPLAELRSVVHQLQSTRRTHAETQRVGRRSIHQNDFLSAPPPTPHIVAMDLLGLIYSGVNTNQGTQK